MALEFFVAIKYNDGSYKLVGGTAGELKGSVKSDLIKYEELLNVSKLTCSIHLPSLQECYRQVICYEPNYCLSEDYCSRSQEREFLGTAEVTLDVGEACFDWYYDDKQL